MVDASTINNNQFPSFVEHFWETLEAIGGYKGIFLLSLAIYIFYGIVHYTVTISRKRRERKRR